MKRGELGWARGTAEGSKSSGVMMEDPKIGHSPCDLQTASLQGASPWSSSGQVYFCEMESSGDTQLR